MAARVSCSLIAVLLCLVKGPVTGAVDLDKELLPGAKPGMCPRNKPDVVGLCAEMCFHDSDCPNNEKCCSNGCGHQCIPPYRAEKPGMCPRNKPDVVGLCAEMCSDDSDCPNNEKCCSNGCGHECMPPYRAEKPGVCPREVKRCDRLMSCANDTDCPKDQKCCSTRCGRKCARPK
ncbi:perlwapin-like isoform X2 [Labeo rohita]|uniref:perlwapin-like isoform X2 n=1 Tax=Labeo rohita TaxID=84645 RepID=UPI0021E3399A|nr:perlwapin-like isoform X2 [Labeo rohita]